MSAIEAWPAFTAPVFSSIGGGNGQFLQVISIDDRICGFADFIGSSGSSYHKCAEELEVTRGSPAVHSFSMSAQEVLTGFRDDLKDDLTRYVDDARLMRRPLVRLDLIEFTECWDRLKDGVDHVTTRLGRVSRTSEDHWRDGVFLTRRIRLALARATGRTAGPLGADDELSSVFLSSRSGYPLVEIGEELSAKLEQKADWQGEVRAAMARYLAAFKISSEQLVFKTTGISSSQPTSRRYEPSTAEDVKDVEWIVCAFGRRLQPALRRRELSTRRDIFVLEEADPASFERLSALIGDRKVQVALVSDVDDRSKATALAASAHASRHFNVSLGVVVASETGPLGSFYWPDWNGPIVRRHILVNAHIEVEKERARFPIARLVRAWLDHLTKQPGTTSDQNSWSAFSLGSNPGGLDAAPLGLRQALAGLATLQFDVRAATQADCVVTSVKRLDRGVREVLTHQLKAFMPSVREADLSWRQTRHQPHSVPVQVSVVAHDVEFHTGMQPDERIAVATENVLRGAGFQIEEKTTSDAGTTFNIGGQVDRFAVTSTADPDYGVHDPNHIFSVASDRVRREFVEQFGVDTPVLRFDQLPFLLGKAAPVELARYMAMAKLPTERVGEHFEERLAEEISEQLLTSPELYGLYQPLQDLSRNTRIEEIDVTFGKLVRLSGYRLRFEGELNIGVELSYGDSEVDSSDSFPGVFVYELGPAGGSLVSATVDVSSFYE